MNFYSDQLINNIIDTEPLDNIITAIEDFKKISKYFIMKQSIRYIHHNYTMSILSDDKNIVAYYCMDNEFAIDNCPSILIYRKSMKNNEKIYYVLFTCTVRKFRGQGYASKLLTGFIERVREENKWSNKVIKIILSSLDTAVLFYEEYGFRWTKESINKHPTLMKYEAYEESKDYYIMELVICT
jgi:GNAT superfamily N-acetyltransferase